MAARKSVSGGSKVKPPGQRVRRNKDQPQWSDLPAEGSGLAAPPLPGRTTMEDGVLVIVEWHAETLVKWGRVWASPMAVNFTEADRAPLERLALLWDLIQCGDTNSGTLSAVTQLEDRFGLSPKGRRQLMWEIKKGEEARAATFTAPRRLRAVEPAV